MKKICNIATAHLRSDTRIIKECLAEKQAYEVHYVTGDGKPYEQKDGLHLYGTKQYSVRLLRAILSPFPIYQTAKQIDADLYVIHNPELLLLVPFLKKRGKAVVWDCHEYYYDEFFHLTGALKPIRRLLAYLYKKLICKIRHNLDGCITICDGLKHSLQTFGFSNIYVLPNYPLREMFPSAPSIPFAKNFYVLHYGVLTAQRNIHLLIQATHRCRNPIRLLLCGYFPFAAYQKQCQQTVGWENVAYYDYATKKQVQMFSQKCFAGILAFVRETQPDYSRVKLYECMALGLPIIAPLYPHYQKTCENDGQPLGICAKIDPQAIADAMDHLYEDKSLCEGLGRHGRKAFEERYTFEAQQGGFLRFLQSIVSQN